MSVEDEVVKKADLKLGFNHRSIIKLMERRDYYKDIFLAERICGFCNAHHALSLSKAVEDIAGVDVPLRARLERTLLCEMERIQSHLLAIGLVGDLTGYRTMLMHSIRIREDMQDSLEVISGQRVTHGLITIGGVRRDITPSQADFVLAKLKVMKKSVPELFDQALSNDVLVGRLKNVGVLKTEMAVKQGAVGPTARGSNVRIDVRKNSPYAAYEDVDWDIVMENGCDCLARLKVKMRETLMSMHIAEQCCDKLKTEKSPLIVPVNELPCKEAISKTEPPRGELLYHVASNGTNTPDFVRIRVPTFITGNIMIKLIQGGWVGDVPAIIGSIDPCFSCTDRVTIIKGEKQDVVNLRDIVRTGGIP
jgi:NADH-quinone oxidoreductase subunit D